MNCVNPLCNRPVPAGEKRRFCRPACYVTYPDGREKRASTASFALAEQEAVAAW
jgi:hypothetical protein